MTRRHIAIASDNCAKAWGQCFGDPRCADTLCPRHPAASCTTCAGGPCPIPLACMTPLAEIPPRITRNLFTPRRLIPATPEGRGRVIGAGLGLAGLFYLAGHVFRYLGLF